MTSTSFCHSVMPSVCAVVWHVDCDRSTVPTAKSVDVSRKLNRCWNCTQSGLYSFHLNYVDTYHPCENIECQAYFLRHDWNGLRRWIAYVEQNEMVHSCGHSQAYSTGLASPVVKKNWNLQFLQIPIIHYYSSRYRLTYFVSRNKQIAKKFTAITAPELCKSSFSRQFFWSHLTKER